MKTQRPRTKPRSPIEMMIDQACGRIDDGTEAITVHLCCVACGKNKEIAAHEAWPDNTAIVQFDKCPDCAKCSASNVRYFDVMGEELFID
jgi:hypothetical protein